MKQCKAVQQHWDLDLVMPELPAQGRWRGGPLTHRWRPGCETLVWHPGDGNRRITALDSVATLQLEDTDRTLAQIKDATTLEAGSPAPTLALGELVVVGVRGVVRLGPETIQFEGLKRIVIGGYSAYPARPEI